MRDPRRFPLQSVNEGHPYQSPVANLKPEMTWWQKSLAGAAAMVVGTACGAVGSHWGGVTKDELNDALSKSEGKLGQRIDAAILKASGDSDKMKAYVDAKVESTLMLWPATKKIKPTRRSE